MATTWAPIGHPPLIRRVKRYRPEISTIVGLTISGKIYKRQFQGSIKGPHVVCALKHFRRHIAGGFILIWDHLRAHQSGLVKTYLEAHPEILVEWLPPYAPEINPEELCHGNVKQHLRNATPTEITQMKPLLNKEFARLRHRPDMILGFFHQAGLSVNKLW